MIRYEHVMPLSYEWRCYVQVRTPNFRTSRVSWTSGPTSSRTQGGAAEWTEVPEWSPVTHPCCRPGKALLLSGLCWTFDIWDCGYHRSSTAQIFRLVKDERQHISERGLHRACACVSGWKHQNPRSQMCMLILIIILAIKYRVDGEGQQENHNSLKSHGVQWLKVPLA